MTDFSKEGTLIVTCAKAMPPFLAAELRELGFPVVRELEAAVETRGSLNDTMTLNLRLRTAHRVLYLLSEFKASHPDQLYGTLRRYPWHEVMDARGYVSVSSSVLTETILDTRFASLRCKDAIVDEIRAVKGARPTSGPEQNRTVVFLYWQDILCRLYLDTSGEPLSRRGYRKIPLHAPMQETLAAGVLMATGWDRKSALVNPMCGSGTIAIEATLMAMNRAPGLLRDNFGFMHILGYESTRWETVRKKARMESNRHIDMRILASDINPTAVEAARQNARLAGVETLIQFDVCDFRNTRIPEGGGVVVLNPEYGERMGRESELEAVYSEIGDFFKKKCAGYRGFVFTGNLALAKQIGLRSKRRIPFFNSRIECRLLEFDLYEGSRREKKRDPGP